MARFYRGKTTGQLQQDAKLFLLLKRQHKKQEFFRSSRKKVRAFIGGNRTGKTVCGAQEVLRYVFGIHENREVVAPVEIWCACPSYDQQLETTQKKLESMIPKYRIKDITYIKKGVWGRIEFDNGSVISFKSYEQGADKFQGTGKRLIWFDEEPPRDIWEEAFIRVEAGIPLDIILTMTPVNGLTWTYDEIFLATSNPDIEVVTATWDDNPWLEKDEMEKIERMYTDDALAVRKEGRYIQRTGLVAGWFDRTIHVGPIPMRQPTWNVYRVIDFGWSSSRTCVLWFGVDTHDRIYIFDGIYANQLNDEDLAQMITDREWNFRVVRGWADNQPDRINTLKRKGIYCEPVTKDGGKEGWDIFRTQAMQKLGAVDPITKKSKLIISNKLVEYDPTKNTEYNYVAKELENLKWKEKHVSGEVTATAQWQMENCPISGSHFDAIDTISYFSAMFLRKNVGHNPNFTTEKRDEDDFTPKRKHIVINPLTGF